jgi:molecular chaperone DnaK
MRLSRCIVAAVLALAGAGACRRIPRGLEVERHSGAVVAGQLVEDIGIETLGGVFTPLLARGRQVPCDVTETFGTAADNQDNVQIRLFRGVAGLARDATPLGRFTIDNLPKRPRGEVVVAVTFAFTADGTLVIRASERSGHAVSLRRSDG